MAGAAAILFCNMHSARAQQTWNLPAGGTWNNAVNWSPAAIPNAIDATATFNSALSGSNPAQTGNRTVTTDVAQTIGSILFNTDAVNAFTTSLTAGAAGSLIFDAAGPGPATITANSIVGATGNNAISAPITLTDSVVANVNNITASSTAGALNLTATISGPGGFTKEGNGLATFGTGAKTYAGATVLNGGRMRMSLAASPTATSSLTVNSGAQLTLISPASYTFGSGPLNLNGSGATAGPFAVFPGAIRNDTSLAVTINNTVVLQSDTLLHVEGAAGSLTLPNSISGPGRLTLTAPGSSANQGQLVLGGNNSFQGGTFVNGGTLVVSNASATLGSGNVTIDNALSPSSVARLTIASGVNNAIADTATLTLAGGGAAGVADQSYADLGAGINEIVGGLTLGGIAQTAGTFGSTLSLATFQNDEYFAGSGVISVVPEPSVSAMLFVGFGVLLGWQRFRRRS